MTDEMKELRDIETRLEKLIKSAFIPSGAPAVDPNMMAGGMPPGPSMMPPGGGMPMDPSMVAGGGMPMGQPPMDPSMMMAPPSPLPAPAPAPTQAAGEGKKKEDKLDEINSKLDQLISILTGTLTSTPAPLPPAPPEALAGVGGDLQEVMPPTAPPLPASLGTPPDQAKLLSMIQSLGQPQGA